MNFTKLFFRFFLLLPAITFLATGCLNYRKTGRQFDRIKKNIDTLAIEDLAKFALAMNYDRGLVDFYPSNLSDEKIRSKFARQGYGGQVQILYGQPDIFQGGVPLDSFVVFRNGFTGELVFDYAANQRDLQQSTGSEYVLWRISRRIYFQKRVIPVM